MKKGCPEFKALIINNLKETKFYEKETITYVAFYLLDF